MDEVVRQTIMQGAKLQKDMANIEGLERGAKKIRLIEYLAISDKTEEELAQQFRVPVGAIKEFKTKYASKIRGRKKQFETNIQDVYDHLWIADKNARLTEYQQTVEDIEEKLTAGSLMGSIDPGLVKLKFQGLRHVAEELGELKPSVQVNNAPIVTYQIEGVDLDNLR